MNFQNTLRQSIATHKNIISEQVVTLTVYVLKQNFSKKN